MTAAPISSLKYGKCQSCGFSTTPSTGGIATSYEANQIAFSHHYWVVEGQLETLSAPFRHVWPSELDLMSRLAGMSLHARWSDWTRAPFTSASTTHVSVWEKPAAAAERP